MPIQRKLVIPGCEEYLHQHKEELGHELGIYHPAASRDLVSSRLTKEIEKKENSKKDCDEE
jgi:hypothetical protein